MCCYCSRNGFWAFWSMHWLHISIFAAESSLALAFPSHLQKAPMIISSSLWDCSRQVCPGNPFLALLQSRLGFAEGFLLTSSSLPNHTEVKQLSALLPWLLTDQYFQTLSVDHWSLLWKYTEHFSSLWHSHIRKFTASVRLTVKICQHSKSKKQCQCCELAVSYHAPGPTQMCKWTDEA